MGIFSVSLTKSWKMQGLSLSQASILNQLRYSAHESLDLPLFNCLLTVTLSALTGLLTAS